MRLMCVTATYPRERIGGAEYQTLLLAEGLARRGHEVTFLAADGDGVDEFARDGVHVVKVPGWRRVGAAEHRLHLRERLRHAAPEVVYTRAFDELGLMVPLCREVGVRSVSVSCHVRETRPLLRSRYAQEVYRHLRSFLAIPRATAHVCNTRDLEARSRRWYPRLDVRTIYNGSPEPPEDEMHSHPTGQVIWVNNMKRWKRPEAYIELAGHLEEYRFVMVGRLPEGRYGERMRARLDAAPPNLHYLGPQPIEEVNRLIGHSDLLLYTSLPVEGFGNSFLQAWFRGVPTVSLSFALDGIPERERIGRCSASFADLVADVRELMANDDERLAMGRRAREYARRCHSVETMLDAYEALFGEVVA